MFDDYYEILDIARTAKLADIVQAYRACKETFSPDSQVATPMFDEAEMQQFCAEIEVAYRTLSDPIKRAVYDVSLTDMEEE